MTQSDGYTIARAAVRQGWPKWLSASLVIFACLFSTTGTASAETRTLKLYFIHTKEKAEITFKQNGRYVQSGLNEINRFLRDWRRNEPTKMDPRLLDLVWEVYQQTGSREYINVVSAYRSPATNSMLRSRSKGVANKSQHMLGKAMDFFIPGVKLATIRELGLKAGAGGVGYYPTSGSPFVHLDVGNVRHWPRMSRSQLLAIFPRGNTMHVGTDGKPLPGYEQALAAYQARQKNGGGTMLASASPRRGGGLLAALFGGGADEAEDVAETEVASAHAPARPNRRGQTPAVAAAPADEDDSAPAAAPAQPEQPQTVIAALPARSVPVPGQAPRQPDASAAMMAALAPTGRQTSGLDARKAVEEAIAAGAQQGNQPVLDAPFKQESEVAFNVPLPTRRPDYKPEGMSLPDTTPVLVAAAERPQPSEGPTLTAAVVDAAAPTKTAAEVKSGAIGAAELVAAAAKKGVLNPNAIAEAEGRDPVAEIAAAYATPAASEPRSAVAALEAVTHQPSEPARPVVARNEVIASSGSELDMGEGGQRLAMLEPQDARSTAAMVDAVKTTSKGARPHAGQAKADPKSMAVPAEPAVAQWALHGEKVAQNTAGTRAPSFAYNIVRTAPREVYTAGFQQDDKSTDANRFTGKAVQFLSVARFTAN